MKNFLLGFAACSLALTTFAQEQPFVCGTDELHQHLIETDPGYLERRAEYEAEIQQLIRENAHLRDDHVVVTIPVVFHVLHLGGRENISDEQIHDAMALLNRDFRKEDPTLNTAIQHFQNIAGDARIEFALPTLDPQGFCTNGINRINTVETLRGRAESKLQPWPRARYLNIWVTHIIESGAAGYATKPGSVEGLGQIRDGIMIRHDYVGAIGTGNDYRSRALTHEVGHYFNLDHPWGATNEPEVNCGDDGVQDTPFTKGHSTCLNNVPPPGPPVNIRYDYTCSMTPIEGNMDFSGLPAQGGTVDPTPAPVATAAMLHVEPIMGFSSFLTSSGNVDITPLPVMYLEGIAGAALTFEPFTAVGLSANTQTSFEFAFSQWALGSDPDLGKYYEFSYHPQPGFGFEASQMRFAVRRTPNGPRRFTVRTGPDFNTGLPLSSVSPNVQVQGGNEGVISDGFLGWVSNVTVDLEGQFLPNDPVTIRFYAWDADDEGGVFAINNVEVVGNIYHESLAYSPFTAVGVSSGSQIAGEFAFSNWDLGAEDGLTDPAELENADPSGAQYYEFTIIPKIEIAMNPTNVTFSVRRSAEGPRTFAVRRASSPSNLQMSAGTNPNILFLSGNRGFFVNDEAGDWINITVNLGATTDPEAPLTLRFLAWNAETEDGYFSIDNVSVTGTFGIIENVENYMEYAYCQKMFTVGQTQRMRAALNSPVGQRNSMWTDNTLQVTGVAEGYQANCAPIADFYVVPGGGGGFANPTIPYPPLTCGNTEVMFKDNSGGGVVTDWFWTFQDGNPATSTERNPIVTFEQPGWKEVSLTVSNAVGEDTKSWPYVVYIGTPEVAMAGLGSYGFEEPLGIWPFIHANYEGNNTHWQRFENGGHTGNACIYLNAGYRDPLDFVDPDNAGDYDDLISPLLNLTGVQDATLSFWYSYSTQTVTLAEATERLELQRSTDCGRTWQWLTGSPASSTIDANPNNQSQLITNGNSTTPGSWVFRSFNIPAAALTENVRFRWRFISSEFSNHLFIDDINIGGPVGIDNMDPNSLMSVYPNPANDHFYVNMTGMDVHPTEITVMDGRGAIVYNKTYAPQGGSGIMISSQDLGIADGLYVIRASNNEGTSTQKLMVGR